MFETATHLLQASFARGEVSPFLFGRVDLAGWAQGLRTLRNYVVRPEGCVSNRQGFGYVGNAVTATPKGSVLLPFTFSATQSYVIEVGASTAQVFSQGAIVNGASVSITAAILTFVSAGPPGWRIQFTTAAAHGLTAGQNCNISGVIGTGSFAAVNGNRRVTEVINSTTFNVAAPLGNTGVYTSGGTAYGIVGFVTPWALGDLAGLRWSQSTDTLTVVHPSYPPYEIKRTSATSFTCLAAVYNNGPFLQQNPDGTTFVYATSTAAGITPPTNGALSQQAGGTLAATTYYVRSTWVTSGGGETLASTETSLAVAVNNVLVVAAPGSPPPSATGWNVYVSTATGMETKQNTGVIALGTAWTEPTTGLITGTPVPSSTNAKSGTVTLTASAGIFNANHVGALIQLTQQDLSQIVPWEPVKQFTGTSIIGQYRRASGKNYLAVSIVFSGTPSVANTGTWIPSHSQGVQSDGDGNTIVGAGTSGVNWLYQDSGFGIVKITSYISPTQVVGTVQPNYVGGPGLLPISVIGGPQIAVGPWNKTGDGSTTNFSLTSPNNTSTDPSKFYVTIAGVYQPPSTYSINAQPGGNIIFLTPPANGAAIVINQISALGQTSFWAFGAFSPDQGYPSAVSYFPDRLILAGTPKQPVGVFGSKTSQYHDFGVSNPVVASDGFSVFLNARQLNAISDLIPLSDLLVGTSNITWRLWPGQTGVALSPLAIAATPQSYYGQSPNCASVLFGDSAIFPEYDGRRLRDLIYQFAFDKFLGQELTLYSRHLIPFGKQFRRIVYKPDPQGQLILALRSDGVLLVCTYLREQQIIGWARWDTQGTFEDICVVPETLSNGTLGFSVYALVNRTINGAMQRSVERLTNREVTTFYDYQFLDCALTYDGRNTSATTMTVSGGSTWLAGDTGTLTASGTSGWANFVSTDPTNNNEIWLFQTLTFVTSCEGDIQGILVSAVTPGAYVVTFSDGECRTITVAADGITCSWTGNLANGTPILTGTVRARCLITTYTSATQVSVRFKDPIPGGLQSAATSVWTFARTTFAGANQLAGMAAVALVDGNVLGIANTQRAANGSLTVGTDGSVTIASAGGVVQLGLPYLCDFETLPLNAQGQESIRMRAKLEPVIYLDVTETRNFAAGTDFGTLLPNVERTFEPYTTQTAMQGGMLWTRLNSTLDSECHTCVRQNMPLPITIRAHIPAVGIGQTIS